jgi:hypothetical protein
MTAVVFCSRLNSFVLVGRTRTDAEFAEMYDTSGGPTLGPFRVDFFRFSSKIRHPTGSALYESFPAFLKPIVHPIFALIFDGKIVAVDQEHFIKVVIIPIWM